MKKGHATVITGKDPVPKPENLSWLPPKKMLASCKIGERRYGLMKADVWYGKDSAFLHPIYNDVYLVVASWVEWTGHGRTRNVVESTEARRTHAIVESEAIGHLVFNAIKDLPEELLK